MQNIYKKIPQINEFLQSEPFGLLVLEYGHNVVAECIRNAVDDVRIGISTGKITEDNINIVIDDVYNQVNFHLKKIYQPAPSSVINATGTILHTNLGRCPLNAWQLTGLDVMQNSYCNLEFNADTGKRDSRLNHISSLIANLTGAEAGAVVNNNAAAVLLVLCSLCANSEVIISRGELVEIGGKFRIPDVLKLSGCKLVEVGTTNKTRIEDYRDAINENTAAIIKVHTSNFKIMGFTEDVATKDLVRLGHENNILIIEDLGSGLLVNLDKYGLGSEPTVPASIEAGVDITCFSGDKLLGGPQAGIICGKVDLIKKITSNQLMRALRIGKLELSVLRQTLLLYLDKKRVLSQIPVLNMITMSVDEVKAKALRLYNMLEEDQKNVSIIESNSCIGGGSMPSVTLDSVALILNIDNVKPKKLTWLLRKNSPCVVGFIKDNHVILDLRTVFEEQLPILSDALKLVFSEVKRG